MVTGREVVIDLPSRIIPEELCEEPRGRLEIVGLIEEDPQIEQIDDVEDLDEACLDRGRPGVGVGVGSVSRRSLDVLRIEGRGEIPEKIDLVVLEDDGPRIEAGHRGIDDAVFVALKLFEERLIGPAGDPPDLVDDRGIAGLGLLRELDRLEEPQVPEIVLELVGDLVGQNESQAVVPFPGLFVTNIQDLPGDDDAAVGKGDGERDRRPCVLDDEERGDDPAALSRGVDDTAKDRRRPSGAGVLGGRELVVVGFPELQPRPVVLAPGEKGRQDRGQEQPEGGRPFGHRELPSMARQARSQPRTLWIRLMSFRTCSASRSASSFFDEMPEISARESWTPFGASILFISAMK